MILERSSGKEYTRRCASPRAKFGTQKLTHNSYVSQLQHHVEDLERLLEKSDQSTQPIVPGMVTRSESAVQAPRYVGDESGNKCVVTLA
jgi:hypothetical protein